MMSNSAMNPAVVAHNLTKVVNEHLPYVQLLVGVVSLSVFSTKESLGLVSVQCTELRGVGFFEVENVLVLR